MVFLTDWEIRERISKMEEQIKVQDAIIEDRINHIYDLIAQIEEALNDFKNHKRIS